MRDDCAGTFIRSWSCKLRPLTCTSHCSTKPALVCNVLVSFGDELSLIFKPDGTFGFLQAAQRNWNSGLSASAGLMP